VTRRAPAVRVGLREPSSPISTGRKGLTARNGFLLVLWEMRLARRSSSLPKRATDAPRLCTEAAGAQQERSKSAAKAQHFAAAMNANDDARDLLLKPPAGAAVPAGVSPRHAANERPTRRSECLSFRDERQPRRTRPPHPTHRAPVTTVLPCSGTLWSVDDADRAARDPLDGPSRRPPSGRFQPGTPLRGRNRSVRDQGGRPAPPPAPRPGGRLFSALRRHRLILRKHSHPQPRAASGSVLSEAT
jgi:hypothetical protein